MADANETTIGIREAIIRECAAVARAHKGSYAKRPNYKSQMRAAADEAVAEIRAEERGEDIAAEIIERAILALAFPTAACHAPIEGTNNLCTRDEGHPGGHRCLAVDVDRRAALPLPSADRRSV